MKKLFTLLALTILLATSANAAKYYFVNNSSCTISVSVTVYDGCPIPPGSSGPSLSTSRVITLAPSAGYEFDEANLADWPFALCAPTGTLYWAAISTPPVGTSVPDGCQVGYSGSCSIQVRGCATVTFSYNGSLTSPSGGIGGFEIN